MISRTRTALIALLLLVAVGGAISWEFGNDEAEVDQNATPNFVEGECPSNGVTLVIDFGTGAAAEKIVRCASEFTGSGWDLLSAAGIDVAGTEAYSIGFVCRIENFPSPQQQDCFDTPKYSEGTWGYFFLDESGIWQVSGVGSLVREPKCGFAEGWRFLLPGEDIGVVKPSITPKVVPCDG